MGGSKSKDRPGFDESRTSGEWELPEEFETGATIQIGDLKSKDDKAELQEEDDPCELELPEEESESERPLRPSISVEVVAEDGLDEAIKSIIPQVIDINQQPYDKSSLKARR